MVTRAVALVVSLAALSLLGCDGQSAADCQTACDEAAAACQSLNRDDCKDGCVEYSDDDTLGCVKAAGSCDEVLTCHHRGLCETLCGDAAEKCGKFAEGCGNECRTVWTHETALCVDRADSCGDLFLCVSL